MTDWCDISRGIALRWISWDLSDDKSTLVQVMAWCRQAISHYLNQCWPRSLPPYGVARPQWVKLGYRYNREVPNNNTTRLFQGPYSLGGSASYCKISWSLEVTRFGFRLYQSLWNLTAISAAILPRCLSNFRALRPLLHPTLHLQVFTRFGDKTSCRLVTTGPVDDTN